MSVTDRLVTKPDGQVIVDLDNVTYWATPLSRLDENIRTCITGHRDALLDARLHLYGDAKAIDQAAARQWAVDAEAGGCEPREWTDIPEPFREAQRRQTMPEPPT